MSNDSSGAGWSEEQASITALSLAANAYSITVFLQKALDVLDRAVEVDGEAWVSAIRAHQEGLTLAGHDVRTARFVTHLEAAYDRRIDELTSVAVYRDVIRDNVQAALGRVRPILDTDQ